LLHLFGINSFEYMKFVLSVGHDPVPFSVSSPFNLLAPN